MLFYIALGLLVYVIYQSGVISGTLRMFGFRHKGLGDGLIHRVDEQFARMKALIDLPMTEAHRHTHMSALQTNHDLVAELAREYTRMFYEKFEGPGFNVVSGGDLKAIVLVRTMNIFQDSLDFLSMVLHDSYDTVSDRVSQLFMTYMKSYNDKSYKTIRGSIEDNADIDDAKTRVATARMIRYAHISVEHAYKVQTTVANGGMSRTG